MPAWVLRHAAVSGLHRPDRLCFLKTLTLRTITPA
jgi:hypothetical protein